MSTSETTLQHIREQILQSHKVVVMVSNPIDTDSLATGLTLRWYFQQLKKECDLVSAFPLSVALDELPQHEGIQVVDIHAFDFAKYDLIVTQDGSVWDRFFGNDYAEVISRLDLQRVINIDHHEKAEIMAAIPRNTVNKDASCTAQIVYYDFLAELPRPLPGYVIEWLGRALVSDTSMFRYYYPAQFKFAEDLIAEGGDYNQLADLNITKDQYEFIGWAITHLQYMPDVRLTLLELNLEKVLEMQQQLGDDWSEVDYYFKAACGNVVRGYDYLIVLKELPGGIVDLRWRTRNYGATVQIADVAHAAGFQAGGHRNAGGGQMRASLAEAKSRLLEQLQKALALL